MPNIVINETEKGVLSSHYLQRLDELRNKRFEIEKEMNDIVERLNSLGVTDLFSITPFQEVVQSTLRLGYVSSWTTAQKAEYLLAITDKMLTAREIASKINEFEGGHYSDYRLNDLTDKVASTLKQKVDKKEAFVRSNLNGIYVYGLIEWLGDNGKMPKKYIN